MGRNAYKNGRARECLIGLLGAPLDPAACGLHGNEQYIVANGHHRRGRTKRANIAVRNSQILRESDGFTANGAHIVAAEKNIAAEKGTTIYDAAKFIRNTAESHG